MIPKLKSSNVIGKQIFSNNFKENEGSNSRLQTIDTNDKKGGTRTLISAVSQFSNFRDEQLPNKHGIETNRSRIQDGNQLEVSYQEELDPNRKGQADTRMRGGMSLRANEDQVKYKATLTSSAAMSLRTIYENDMLLNQCPLTPGKNAETSVLRKIEMVDSEFVFNRLFEIARYISYGDNLVDEAKTIWVESHFLDQIGGNNTNNHYCFSADSSIISISNHGSFQDFGSWFEIWEPTENSYCISQDFIVKLKNYKDYRIDPKLIYISGKVVRNNTSLFEEIGQIGFNIFESPYVSLEKAFDNAVRIIKES